MINRVKVLYRLNLLVRKLDSVEIVKGLSQRIIRGINFQRREVKM